MQCCPTGQAEGELESSKQARFDQPIVAALGRPVCQQGPKSKKEKTTSEIRTRTATLTKDGEIFEQSDKQQIQLQLYQQVRQSDFRQPHEHSLPDDGKHLRDLNARLLQEE
ncbi:hypothetical protein ACLMJK_003209 [Lecanora helva]